MSDKILQVIIVRAPGEELQKAINGILSDIMADSDEFVSIQYQSGAVSSMDSSAMILYKTSPKLAEVPVSKPETAV